MRKWEKAKIRGREKSILKEYICCIEVFVRMGYAVNVSMPALGAVLAVLIP